MSCLYQNTLVRARPRSSFGLPIAPVSTKSTSSRIHSAAGKGFPVSDVVVAVSTYQGERFLAEQLESLQRQTFADWTLLLRDDGSHDSTRAIAERFAAADPRILLVPSEKRLGPTQSFGGVLEPAVARDAGHVFLCDQDDVWLPDKMQCQLDQMYAAEQALGVETPLLVHSDLTVVDENLAVHQPSFLHSQRLRHLTRRPLETLAVQNFATGCTMLANRALLDAALPIPATAVLHDWWLALIAAGTGRILFDPVPLVLYRQHDANAVGAKGYWLNLWDAVFRRGKKAGWKLGAIPPELDAVLCQTEAAADWLADFNPPAGRWLAEFVALWRDPPARGRRLAALRRLGGRRLDPLRHLLLQARLFLATAQR